jgi:hypothetical protein
MDYEKVKPLKNMVVIEVVKGEAKAELEKKFILEVKEGRPTGVIVGRVRKVGPEVIDVEEKDIVLLPARAMNNPDANMILVSDYEILAVQE